MAKAELIPEDEDAKEEKKDDEKDEEDHEEQDEDSEDEEKKQREERIKKGEYIEFRRGFDKLKQQHQGTHAESTKIKEQGNNMFSLGLFSQAAMLYSEAIELQPDNPVLYCNRSMAYLKQDLADQALADAEKSLELDVTESNIKAYWRKAQALLDLDRSEESEVAADEGIALQPGNRHLNQVRRKAREVNTMKRLCGVTWVGQVNNGIEKKLKFNSDGVMTMSVFGHEVPATFDLSVEGTPHSMYIKMKPDGDVRGTGPPPPPIPYIYEFHEDDQELWICHPVGTTELPTKFEGPGFDRLRRTAGDSEPVEDEDSEPLDVRCERYMRDMNEAMPLMPAQLPERPAEDEINEEALLMERVSQLKRRFGLKVHQRAVDLAKDPTSAPSAELAEQATSLQRRLVLRKILPPPPELVAPLAAHADAPAAAAAAAPAATPAVSGNSAHGAQGESARGPPKSCLGGIVAAICGGEAR